MRQVGDDVWLSANATYLQLELTVTQMTQTIRSGTLAFGFCGFHLLLHSRIGIIRYEWLPHILLISKYYGASCLL
jgi:hypothetical protein